MNGKLFAIVGVEGRATWLISHMPEGCVGKYKGAFIEGVDFG